MIRKSELIAQCKNIRSSKPMDYLSSEKEISFNFFQQNDNLLCYLGLLLAEGLSFSLMHVQHYIRHLLCLYAT